MVFNARLLGISSSIPLKDRNHTSLAIRFDGDVILFDCGEGIQQQFMKSKLSFMDINAIFITHFHADHFLGLPGLLATMSLHKRTIPIKIFGPVGIKERVESILKSFTIELFYDLEFFELFEGKVYETKNYEVYAKKMNHQILNYGFVFKEKDKVGTFSKVKALKLGIPEGPLFSELQNGKTIIFNKKEIKPLDVMDYSLNKKGLSLGYIVDCNDKGYENFIKDLDILFHETTFMKKDSLQAKKTLHSITTDVAKIAKDSNVKNLIIMNFSARYTNLEEVLYEVQNIYDKAEIGEELKIYEIKK